MTDFLSEIAAKRKAEHQSRISQPVRDLIQSVINGGPRITWQQLNDFISTHGMTSWEREEIVPYMDDDCLIHRIEHCLENCKQKYRSGPCSTYDESIVYLWMPEIIKRLQAK